MWKVWHIILCHIRNFYLAVLFRGISLVAEMWSEHFTIENLQGQTEDHYHTFTTEMQI